MKKMLMILVTMLTIAVSATAMSFEQARREALFLTDKMAYELNLTEEQYEACYEINLDYLMGVTGRTDVFGVYWERRNLDLSYILMDWQWNAFIAASYFYRPLYWEAGYWHFGIYARYPHRDYFYFGTPTFYISYRGGHAWHMHGDRGYYYGHREHFRAPRREHVGMHDRWDRGDFHGNRSSTRVTGRPEGRGRIENGGRVNRDRGVRSQESGARRPESGIRNRQVEGHREFGNGGGSQTRPNNNESRPNVGSRPNSGSRPERSIGSGSGSTRPERSIGSGSGTRPERSIGTGSSTSRPSSIGSSSRPSRDFGSSSSSSTSNRNFSSSSRPSSSVSRPSSSASSHSTPSRSFGSSASAPSRSSSAPSRSMSSGPSRSSSGGGSRSAGGHAGGRR